MTDRLGPYELHERIGIGGMAEVLRATMHGADGFRKEIALKRILPHVADDDEFISMFIEEAKIAVQLSHPNICQVLDLGKEGDTYFIAMELIDGKTLTAIEAAATEKHGAMPVNLALFVAKQVCAALNYAHTAARPDGQKLSLVHRDITPQNILISFDGNVKVVDFGLARATGRDYETRAGVVKGKMSYLSPEQVNGSDIDFRSDIFSLGVCLWQWLAGRKLFERDNDIATLMAIRDEEVPPLERDDVTPAIEAIIKRATAKEPAERFEDASAFQEELFEAATDYPPLTRRKVARLLTELFPNASVTIPPSATSPSTVDVSEFDDDPNDMTHAVPGEMMKDLAKQLETQLKAHGPTGIGEQEIDVDVSEVESLPPTAPKSSTSSRVAADADKPVATDIEFDDETKIRQE